MVKAARRGHLGDDRHGADAQRLGATCRLVPSQGREIVLVPAEQSSDLRKYYAKHAKTDRLDSRLLARLRFCTQMACTGRRRSDQLRR